MRSVYKSSENVQSTYIRSLTRENFDSGREATVGVDFMAWVLRVRGCKVKYSALSFLNCPTFIEFEIKLVFEG